MKRLILGESQFWQFTDKCQKKSESASERDGEIEQKSRAVFFCCCSTQTRPAWAGFKTAEEGRTKIM